MSKSRAGARGILAFATACVLAFSAASSATALQEKAGYLECNAGKSLYVTSTTTTAGTGGHPFVITHRVIGVGSKTWNTGGYHSEKFLYGGQWDVYTSGTLASGGASCGA